MHGPDVIAVPDWMTQTGFIVFDGEACERYAPGVFQIPSTKQWIVSDRIEVWDFKLLRETSCKLKGN